MLYVKIIWICQGFSFFLPCAWLPSSCCHACYLAMLHFLFACFYRNQLCSPAINQTSLRQSKGWFPSSYFADEKNIITKSPLGLYINYVNRILPVTYKVVKFLRRFCSNILFKILILFFIVIVIVSFGWFMVFTRTFNRCELLCNLIITQLTLNKKIQFNSVRWKIILVW